MKKAILLSLVLAGASLNADVVQPRLPDNIDRDAIQQLITKIESNELTQEEVELLLQAQDNAALIDVGTVAWYALHGIFGIVLLSATYRFGQRIKEEVKSLSTD